MKKFLSYGSIARFEKFVKDFKHHCEYTGTVDSIPQYDESKDKPVIDFKGTVKLHGTNASVVYDHAENMLYPQSRRGVISIKKDNAGFASFVDHHYDALMELVSNIYPSSDHLVTVYGEWVGKGIHKGVAVNQLERKTFVVFGVKVSPKESEDSEFWLNFDDIENIKYHDIDVYNVLDFKTFDVRLDFNHPNEALKTVTDLALSVEEQCPVGKYFDIEGVGEGIVFYGEYQGNTLKFKVKGDKHKGSGKAKVPLTEEQLAALSEKQKVATLLTPSWRLEQGLDEVFDRLNGGTLDITRMKDYIKWVIDDIVKEDMHILHENDMILKDVSGYVSKAIVAYFKEEDSIL